MLKIGTPLTRALGNVYTYFDFSTGLVTLKQRITTFLFSSYKPVRDTDRQTDRPPGRTCNAAYRTAT